MNEIIWYLFFSDQAEYFWLEVVVFVFVFFLLVLQIYHATPFCKVSAEKSLYSLVPLYVTLAAFLDSVFIFNFCHFNYHTSWCRSFCVHLIWESLLLIPGYMFPFHGHDLFRLYFFKSILFTVFGNVKCCSYYEKCCRYNSSKK